MIYEALNFVTEELNDYFRFKQAVAANLDAWVMGNVARLFDGDSSNNTGLTNTAILTLVNVEEDRISKSPVNYYREGDTVVYRNPAIHLNLYCLFSINRSYEDSLKWLTLLVQFFQKRNVFDHTNSPGLDSRIEQLIFDMHTLNFEQVNHLWGTLGGKHLPSMLYKVRMVMIQEEAPNAMGEYVKKMGINERPFNN